MIQELPITHVFPRPDARKTDEATVRGLMKSIADVGIINPIRVRPARRAVNGIDTDAYEVTAGYHRLKAARRLELATVPCILISDDDLHAELAMIDENLMRAELSPAERAAQTARRKAIFEELHPETKYGQNQHTRGVAETATPGERFSKETAAAIGKSERTVQMYAERGEKISAQALSLVSHTNLDTGSYLDKLKKIDPEKQVARVQVDLEKTAERREIEGRNKTASRLVELSDAEGCADWLLHRIDLMEIPELISWLQRVPPKDIIGALSRKAA